MIDRHAIAGRFNIALHKAISDLSSVHRAFTSIHHIRKRHEKDVPTYRVEDFPYVTYSGRMRFQGFTCGHEIYRGLYRFEFWDNTDEKASRIAGDFQEHFMKESYFTSYSDGEYEDFVTVMYKNPSFEDMLLDGEQTAAFVKEVEFQISTPRNK